MEGMTVRVKDVIVLYLSREPHVIRIGGAELIASWRWGRITFQ